VFKKGGEQAQEDDPRLQGCYRLAQRDWAWRGRGRGTIEATLNQKCARFADLDAIFGTRPNLNPPFSKEISRFDNGPGDAAAMSGGGHSDTGEASDHESAATNGSHREVTSGASLIQPKRKKPMKFVDSFLKASEKKADIDEKHMEMQNTTLKRQLDMDSEKQERHHEEREHYREEQERHRGEQERQRLALDDRKMSLEEKEHDRKMALEEKEREHKRKLEDRGMSLEEKDHDRKMTLDEQAHKLTAKKLELESKQVDERLLMLQLELEKLRR
jgi:hypothetical protein